MINKRRWTKKLLKLRKKLFSQFPVKVTREEKSCASFFWRDSSEVEVEFEVPIKFLFQFFFLLQKGYLIARAF